MSRLTANLHDERAAATKHKFDVVVSLGYSCQTAEFIKKHGFRFQSHPLDWVITSFDSLVLFILNEGKNFFEKESLLFNVTYPKHVISKAVMETHYGIYSLHDLVYSTDDGSGIKRFHQVILANYEIAKEKFDRRILRFFNLLKSNKKILFIRLGIERQEAILLDQLLHLQYPQLEYLILALDEREEMKIDWGLDRVKNFYVELYPGGQREQLWDEIFKRYRDQIAVIPASG